MLILPCPTGSYPGEKAKNLQNRLRAWRAPGVLRCGAVARRIVIVGEDHDALGGLCGGRIQDLARSP